MEQGRRRFVRSAMGVAARRSGGRRRRCGRCCRAAPDVTIGSRSRTRGRRDTVAIETGDTVTFDYTGSAGVVAQPQGRRQVRPRTRRGSSRRTSRPAGTDEHTFNLPGTYDFVCQAHPADDRRDHGRPVTPVDADADADDGHPTPTPTADGDAATVDAGPGRRRRRDRPRHAGAARHCRVPTRRARRSPSSSSRRPPGREGLLLAVRVRRGHDPRQEGQDAPCGRSAWSARAGGRVGHAAPAGAWSLQRRDRSA